MKSNKQRRIEIKQRRWKRIEAMRQSAPAPVPPAGAIAANMERLAWLNSGTCWWHPGYYVDIAYRCSDCGAACTWTAQSQKWWYEDVQGSLHAGVSRCTTCRAKYRAWRQSHCNATEMQALSTLWRDRPDQAARDRVERGLAAADPAIRCYAAQALAWWWVQFDDAKADERLEDVELEKSWALRIHRIVDGELELRAGVHRVCRAERLAA